MESKSIEYDQEHGTCQIYEAHLLSLSKIYSKEYDHKQFNVTKSGIVDYRNSPLINLEKAKKLNHNFVVKQTRRGQDRVNMRLLTNIKTIQMGNYKTEIPKYVVPHEVKSLRKEYFERQQRKICTENESLRERICSVRSEMSRDTILKSTTQILSHQTHLSKFKTSRRSDIKLPDILAKRQTTNKNRFKQQDMESSFFNYGNSSRSVPYLNTMRKNGESTTDQKFPKIENESQVIFNSVKKKD